MTALFADYRPADRSGAPPDGLATREAVPSDLEGLAALRVERGDATRDEALAFLGRHLDRASRGLGHLVAAHVGDRVVAYGAVDRLAFPDLPAGWYLGGVVVAPDLRRRGIGRRLTTSRMDWVGARSSEVYYFVNSTNLASIDLPAHHGFEEVARGIRVPNVTFSGAGVGVLFRAILSKPAP